MSQDTDGSAVRVSPEQARDTARRLRAALADLGIQPDDVRQIIPASSLDDGGHVRLGTWDPASATLLADALTARPPFIGRPDAPPLPPTAQS